MTVVEADSAMAPAIGRLLDNLRPRANSLLVTVFGDSIMPRGGNIWLSDLVVLMRPFGLSERLVRTGVYRLSQEGWLTSRSVGRRAQYALSESGLQQFSEASRRIYSSKSVSDNNEWTLVQAIPEITQEERQALRRCLKWHGFGQLSTTMLALPGPVPSSLAGELESQGLASKVLVFSSTLTGLDAQTNMKPAAAAAWPLEDLNAQYARFLDIFADFAGKKAPELSGEEQFVLRTLLVHEYRKILLKDPHLPLTLLPAPWNGTEALQTTGFIYKQTAKATDDHVGHHMTENGDQTPALSDEYGLRFGGSF